jgi:hypothetical protein
VGIGARETAEVCALSKTDTCHEETHWLRRSSRSASTLWWCGSTLPGGGLLPEYKMGAGSGQREGHEAGE